MRTVAFCEIDPYCRAVLAKHWPGVPCYDDVRTLDGDRLRADGIAADVICGGFPCQDISVAGSGAGIDGQRSGLWSEYARIIGDLRPRFVIVENVSALLGRGLDVVLRDLAALGYDAEWHCISASAVGAPHRRDRVWIVAYPASERRDRSGFGTELAGRRELADGREDVAHAISSRQSRPRQHEHASHPAPRITRQAIDAFHGCVGSIWATEPAVGRVAYGVPNRVDRLSGLGNAVVPQIPEIIGRAIMLSSHHQSPPTGEFS